LELADRFAAQQREISVAEFFERNRHLMGFESQPRALLTAVKEMVDNSLDACEQGRILPDIRVEVERLDGGLYRVVVSDNGPGIADSVVPGIFGKLLYGSRFHSTMQSRGQQGMGVSAAVLYAQLTSGLPATVTTSTSPGEPARSYNVRVGIQHNEPDVQPLGEQSPWEHTGTSVEIILEATYVRGRQSIHTYIEATALVNPHLELHFSDPLGEKFAYPRRTGDMPARAEEVLPHPNGVELGTLLSMLEATRSERILPFLINEFSRLGRYRAGELCAQTGIDPATPPHDVARNLNNARALHGALRDIRIAHPPSKALSPIGEGLLRESASSLYDPLFIATATRQPFSCGGYPMLVETVLAYGGSLQENGVMRLMRFANRVPLLYQSGACAITRAVESIVWKQYMLERTRNERLPGGPLLLAVHVASSNVPFTSESKDAIASLPEVIREIELAVKETARPLRAFLVRRKMEGEMQRRTAQLRAYNREVAIAIASLTGGDTGGIRIQLDELVDSRMSDGRYGTGGGDNGR